ncbi:Copia protein [Habropoda laboriosa]|uniref:Copia protein n=1 Tax=Habropoda laboriosa TaxID=597456 RepID=A0A0L7QKB2_9HYME|nr:Copia protein [Habropoda laboriosa]
MDQLKVKRNIIPFNGDKYSVWKFRIRSLLTELSVIKVIDERVPDKKPNDWDKAENTAKSIIIEFLSDSFLGFASGSVTAKEIIENLDKIYERKSLATQLAIRKKLLSLKLQGDIPLVKHFTVFNDLITELSAAGAKLEETDKVAHLLLTLPPSYDGVITAIETLSEDTLTLAFVKTRLLDHEVKIKAESTDTSAKVLYTGNAINTTRQPDFDISKTKGFARKFGQFNRFKNNRRIPGIKCHHCNKLGHMKRECRYYLKELKQKNHKETIHPSLTMRMKSQTIIFCVHNRLPAKFQNVMQKLKRTSIE